jgi:phosphate transport system protein
MSIRSEYDRELAAMHNDIAEMGALVEHAIDSSIEALNNLDMELAKNITEGDRRIDELDHNIETQCLRLLLRQQPVASDLRTISAALKMLTDMERIGDNASDISEITQRFTDKREPTNVRDIPAMGRAAADMVHGAVTAFVARDAEAAMKIIKSDDAVDALFDSVKGEIVAALAADPSCADRAVDLLIIARYLERIGDHAVNICGWTLFCITGVHREPKEL